MCGFERSGRIANHLKKVLEKDNGAGTIEDDTRGWDGDRMALLQVWYNSKEDYLRLDEQVRSIIKEYRED